MKISGIMHLQLLQRSVILVKANGAVPERPKGTVCKTVFHRFESDRHLRSSLRKWESFFYFTIYRGFPKIALP